MSTNLDDEVRRVEGCVLVYVCGGFREDNHADPCPCEVLETVTGR